MAIQLSKGASITTLNNVSSTSVTVEFVTNTANLLTVKFMETNDRITVVTRIENVILKVRLSIPVYLNFRLKKKKENYRYYVWMDWSWVV